MEFLTVAQAADRLGVTVQAVYDAHQRGELERVPGDGVILLTGTSVDAFGLRRRRRAAAGVDPLTAARFLSDRLRPPPEPLTVDGRSVATGEAPQPPEPVTRETLRTRRDAALTHMPALRGLFGADVLDAVLLTDGCPWCASGVPASEVFADRDGASEAVYRLVFGAEPCSKDMARWNAEVTETQQREAARRAAADRTAADGRMRADAVRFAELALGRPYRLDADGPVAFDCSGLVRWAYAQAAGVLLPSTRGGLPTAGQPVALADLEPGDLVLDGPGGHVGLYAAQGRVIHAAEGGGVQYTALSGFSRGVRPTRTALLASGQAVDDRSLNALTALAALRAVAAEQGIPLDAS